MKAKSIVMKKSASIILMLASSIFTGMSQGYFNARNAGTPALLTIPGPLNTIIVGTDSVAAGYVGTGPGQVTIEGFVAPENTDLSTWVLEIVYAFNHTPIETVQNSSSTMPQAQGTFEGGNPFTLPTAPGLYDGSVKLKVFFLGFSAGDAYEFLTPVADLAPAPAGTGFPAPALFGTGVGQISSFTLVSPEPSTYALGGLGAAIFWMFRRRK